MKSDVVHKAEVVRGETLRRVEVAGVTVRNRLLGLFLAAMTGCIVAPILIVLYPYPYVDVAVASTLALVLLAALLIGVWAIKDHKHTCEAATAWRKEEDRKSLSRMVKEADARTQQFEEDFDAREKAHVTWLKSVQEEP